jgi:hypothetical protein
VSGARRPRATWRGLVLLAGGLLLWVACPGPQPPGGMDPGPHAVRPAELDETSAEEVAGGAGAPAAPSFAPWQEARPAATPAAEVRPGAPATLALELPGPVRRQVRRLGGASETAPQPLRLVVTGLPDSAAPVALRAFVNLPQAGPDTPLASPHYAGTYPLPSAGGADPSTAAGSILVDLARVLAALPPEERLADGRIHLTLVAVPLRAGAALPPDLAVPIGGVHVDRGAPGPADDP